MTEHILLAEDNPRDVEITLDLLASARPGSIVTVVHNGEEVLDFLSLKGDFRLRAPGHPTLILLDVKMPKVTGLELLARLRSDPAIAAIAVVILSSSRHEKDMLEAHDLGADGYLLKPVTAERLAGAIELALRERREKRAP